MSKNSHENCQYCCGDVDVREYLLLSGDIGIYIDENGNLTGEDDLEFLEKKLNYCPMCGRKL